MNLVDRLWNHSFIAVNMICGKAIKVRMKSQQFIYTGKMVSGGERAGEIAPDLVDDGY